VRPLDDTDRQILRLLREDGRIPYSEIGEAVDLSGPAVSDRIDRLRERGIVQGFSVDLDRSVLREGVPMVVTLDVEPGLAAGVADDLAAIAHIDRVLRTAGERVLFTASVPDGEPTTLLADAGVLDAVNGIEAELIASRAINPGLGEVEFAPECVECGNTVDEEGVRATVGAETYYFCCASCEAAFRDRSETIEEGV